MPYFRGLTVVVGHAPRPGTEPHQIPSIYSEIEFEEFLSKSCHDQSTGSRIHRFIEVDDGRKIIVLVEVGIDFDWGAPDVNALRLSMTYDDEILSQDVDIFIGRPISSVSQADEEGVKPFASFQCSFDEFPMPVKDAPDVDQTVNFVVRALPIPEDMQIPKAEAPNVVRDTTFGSIRIHVQRVTILKKTEARKGLQRTSNASFIDDNHRGRKPVQMTNQLLKKGITSRIQHENADVRMLQRPNFKVAKNGLVGSFIFHYRLPDRFNKLLKSPCRIVSARNGTRAETPEAGELLQPITEGNRHVRARIMYNRTSLDRVPEQVGQEEDNRGMVNDKEAAPAPPINECKGLVGNSRMVLSNHQACGHQAIVPPEPDAKTSGQGPSSNATGGRTTSGPKESTAYQNVVKAEAPSGVGRDAPTDEGDLARSRGETSHDVREPPAPPPSKALQGLSGDVSEDEDQYVPNPQELLDRLTLYEAAAMNLKAKIASLDRTVTEKRTAQAPEILQLEETQARITREFEDAESQWAAIRDDFGGRAGVAGDSERRTAGRNAGLSHETQGGQPGTPKSGRRVGPASAQDPAPVQSPGPPAGGQEAKAAGADGAGPCEASQTNAVSGVRDGVGGEWIELSAVKTMTRRHQARRGDAGLVVRRSGIPTETGEDVVPHHGVFWE